MVARIKPGRSIRKSFFYNETKVEEGQAKWLHAENYPVSGEDLTQDLRLRMLEKLAALKPNVAVNSVHISLNFDPSEVISEEQYVRIAREYMERLGFGNQPYLIYQHYDAAHPHVHVLTTNIESENSRIDLHHLGIHMSEPARIAVEKMFGLVEAEGKNSIDYKLKPISAEQIVYGKRETKKALSVVLEALHKRYKYTSLAEFNALLKLYNVRADRGAVDSRIYNNQGLLYRVLDAEGKPVGVPIKASGFHFQPTLKNLETHFQASDRARKPFRDSVKSKIDFYLLQARNPTLAGLVSSLEKSGIAVVLRQNEQGQTYGITYIDHKTQCVFNGSDLGKEYSARNIIEKTTGLSARPVSYKISNTHPDRRYAPIAPFKAVPPPDFAQHLWPKDLIEQLLSPEADTSYMPYELAGRKRKKKKRKGNSNT
ncbi:relaxase/mobilization nuclease domain-containing protein [Pedobacter frigoris]|uniref:relaxase/mobilization nuclease domain-containing protein n=1 Tax=Pedobacter frigoris TaxID=2571272 RepID=UPI00292F540C|nr:relaxase/mobilization nuclease domain-containing protein [Pedobacter frigoris]